MSQKILPIKIKFKLNSETRRKLSKPLGRVFSEEGALKFLKRQMSGNKNLGILAVGDETGRFLLSNHIEPSIWIYDGKVKRKKIKSQIPVPDYVVRNPRSVITEGLCNAIDDALSMKARKKALKIYVIGEEDLAAIYLLYKARSSLILYGQPDEGIVIIKTSKKVSNDAFSVLRKMKERQ